METSFLNYNKNTIQQGGELLYSQTHELRSTICGSQLINLY